MKTTFQSLVNKNISTALSSDKVPCDCLPDCESNYYISEISMGKLNVELAFQQDHDLYVSLPKTP